MPIWQPDTGGCHHSAADRGRRWTGASILQLRSANYALGSRVETFDPDSNSRNAISVTPMDLSTRPPSARAGYNQGKAVAVQLTEFWR
jgi:hypothetical protein